MLRLIFPKEFMEYYDLAIGKLSKEKTYIADIRNYPKNTAIEINYGFFNPKPKPSGSVDAWLIKDIHLFLQDIYLSKCQMTVLRLELQTKELVTSLKKLLIYQHMITIQQEIS
jgi:hypothetical protein